MNKKQIIFGTVFALIGIILMLKSGTINTKSICFDIGALGCNYYIRSFTQGGAIGSWITVIGGVILLQGILPKKVNIIFRVILAIVVYIIIGIIINQAFSLGINYV